jgi:hypothetical protein
MHNAPQGFSGRLRHYVTLVIQIVPFIVLALNISATNWYKLGLLVLPLLLASVGPVLELAGHRCGRSLTLTGLGLQIVGAIAFIAAVVIAGEGAPVLSADDLPGLGLIVGLILVPTVLFVWNLRAGRGPQPSATAQA